MSWVGSNIRGLLFVELQAYCLQSRGDLANHSLDAFGGGAGKDEVINKDEMSQEVMR